jgi:hypothetical protein
MTPTQIVGPLVALRRWRGPNSLELAVWFLVVVAGVLVLAR